MFQNMFLSTKKMENNHLFCDLNNIKCCLHFGYK